VIAKRRDSLYEPGRRSGAWVKMRVNKSRELVVGGYVANGKTSIRSLSVIAKEMILFTSLACAMDLPLRDAVFKKFRRLETPNGPFVNLPQRDKGRWRSSPG
jgi:hypothetical protein